MKGPEDAVIARAIRLTRMKQGLSQRDLAELSETGIKTIYRIESGRSATERSLNKVCQALGITLEGLRALPQDAVDEAHPYRIHRKSQDLWFYLESRNRARPPQDEFDRIQDPAERRRLGTLGFVPMFVTLPSFFMPEGPEVVRSELYARIDASQNANPFLESFLRCTRGRLRCVIRGEELEMEEGEVVGCHTADIGWMEPATTELPVLLMVVSGDPVGVLPEGDLQGKRAVRVKDGEGVRDRRIGGPC